MRRALGWRDALGLLELVRVIRRERPQIVHAHSSKAGVLARLAAALCRVPARVFTAHGWAFKAEAGRRATAYLWADRLVAPLTSAVVCVSETERRAGLAARTCHADRTVVIRNGIGAIDGRPGREGERTRHRLVSVGRLKAPKDMATLLDALALLGDVELDALVVGDGPDAAALREQVERLGLEGRVRLCGERDDVPALLAEADCFVLSSRSEGLPVSILEAMAAELPVVASAVGGVPELVEDGETGFLVPPGDPAALADALRRMLTDAELRRRLGAAGRARVEREFTLDAFLAAHLDLYDSLLRRRPVRARTPALAAAER